MLASLVSLVLEIGTVVEPTTEKHMEVVVDMVLWLTETWVVESLMDYALERRVDMTVLTEDETA